MPTLYEGVKASDHGEMPMQCSVPRRNGVHTSKVLEAQRSEDTHTHTHRLRIEATAKRLEQARRVDIP